MSFTNLLTKEIISKDKIGLAHWTMSLDIY